MVEGMRNMINSIESLITLDEGRRVWPYTDTRGDTTWGIGHNLTASPACTEAMELVNKAVDVQFAHDLAAVTQWLAVAHKWTRALSRTSPPRYAVMVDICFNVGIGGFAEFTEFLGYMRDGLYGKAASDLLGTTAAQELPDRYERLASILESGQWPPEA